MTHTVISNIRSYTLIGILICLMISGEGKADTQANQLKRVIPVSPFDLVIEPDTTKQLSWHVEQISDAVTCLIYNYDLKVVSEQILTIDTNTNHLSMQVNLPRGYYEIRFPDTSQIFGLISLEPADDQQNDPFWCVDTSLSWHQGDSRQRQAAINILARQKISMVRERFGWPAVEASSGQWNWQTTSKYEQLRMDFAKAGVCVTEMFHTAPKWTGAEARNAFPTDLVAVSQSWATIGKRWQKSLAQIEMWNEPDTNVFSGNMPPDQLASFYAAMDYTFYSHKIDLPLIMGGLTNSVLHPNRDYLHIFEHAGILEHIDAFAFHNHDEAAKLLDDIHTYRQMFKRLGRSDLPLINSESGRAWKNDQLGDDTLGAHPSSEQGRYVAQETVMKAIDTRAAGIAQFYAFVYPYYQENRGNWGLVDRDGTPTPALAGYFNAKRLLTNAHFVGELKQRDPSLVSSRLFERDGRYIAVLFTGKIGQNTVIPTSVDLDLPYEQIIGIDGRVLMVPRSGRIPVSDGLAYVLLEKGAKIDSLVRQDTALMTSWQTGHKAIPHANSGPTPSPIILQRHLVTGEDSFSVDRGLVVKASEIANIPINLRIWNLGQDDDTLNLQAHPFNQSQAPLASQSVHIKAGTYSQITMHLDLSDSLSASKPAYVQIAAINPKTNISPIAFSVHQNATSDQLLNPYPMQIDLPIANLKRWNNNTAKNSELNKFKLGEDGWGFDVTFQSGGNWCYPMFGTHGISLDGIQGVYVKGRAMRPAAVRVIVYHKNGVAFFTPGSIFPADGKWHQALIKFEDLKVMKMTAHLGSSELDTSKIVGICLGFNSLFLPDNRLEVEQVKLVGQ